MRRLRGALGAFGAAVLFIAVGVVGTAAPAAAAESNAVVVVDTGDAVDWVPISFSGTITGVQALQLAGANLATYGFAGQGLAVCSINGTGHAATDDACLGTPDDPRYWAYFRAPSGATGWSYARQGGGGSTVGDGDVEGWRFGTGAAPRVGVCAVTDCAPPAPPEQPAGGTGPAPAADPGGGTANPASGSGAAAASGAAGVAPTATDGDAPTADTAPPTTAIGTVARSDAATGANGANGPRRGATRALGPLPSGGDGGSGSPVGVVAAAALIAAIAGVALVFRRRARSPG
ncbi:MAG: hypothetical protein WDA60_16865 [Acidimicrobiia bacterium]|jgi:hypothetical protein